MNYLTTIYNKCDKTYMFFFLNKSDSNKNAQAYRYIY